MKTVGKVFDKAERPSNAAAKDAEQTPAGATEKPKRAAKKGE